MIDEKGAPEPTRTANLRFRKAALYPLSYGGIAEIISECDRYSTGFGRNHRAYLSHVSVECYNLRPTTFELISAHIKNCNNGAIMRPFFVYGTLLPGQLNYSLWENDVISCQPATIWAATLYDMGAYPMLIEGHEGVVSGQLIEIDPDQYEQVLARIDTLEQYDERAHRQSAFIRVARQIQCADGSQVVGWVYVGQPKNVTGMSPIGGNWVEYSAEKHPFKPFTDDATQYWQTNGTAHQREKMTG